MDSTCLVVWPAVAGPDADHLRPILDPPAEHTCILPSAHVRGEDPRWHTCTCGSRSLVRDVEPVR